MDFYEVLVVGLVTCFFSFGVQFFVYLYYKYIDHKILKIHKSVVHYSSGILGDGLFMPLVNIFCYYTIKALPSVLSIPNLALSLAGGVIITFIFHYGQQRLNLTNWTMPEKGMWNILGIYHALFMFAESTFLTFTLITFLSGSTGLSWGSTFQLPTKYSFLVLGIFLASFLYDYRKDLGFIRSKN